MCETIVYFKVILTCHGGIRRLYHNDTKQPYYSNFNFQWLHNKQG